jgi:hypothetical protein
MRIEAELRPSHEKIRTLREYLLEILPKVGQWPISRVGQLTPTAWKATQARKS